MSRLSRSGDLIQFPIYTKDDIIDSLGSKLARSFILGDIIAVFLSFPSRLFFKPPSKYFLLVSEINSKLHSSKKQRSNEREEEGFLIDHHLAIGNDDIQASGRPVARP